jgi:hypothetical protein
MFWWYKRQRSDSKCIVLGVHRKSWPLVYLLIADCLNRSPLCSTTLRVKPSTKILTNLNRWWWPDCKINHTNIYTLLITEDHFRYLLLITGKVHFINYSKRSNDCYLVYLTAVQLNYFPNSVHATGCHWWHLFRLPHDMMITNAGNSPCLSLFYTQSRPMRGPKIV